LCDFSPQTGRRAKHCVCQNPATVLNVTAVDVTDDALLDVIIAQPVLVNRPIVRTPKGVRLCRPSKVVLDLLERLPLRSLARKDDGLMIDAQGNCLGGYAQH
jgi:arsenate reductase